MPPFLASLAAHLPDTPSLVLLAAAILIAGLVRGFSGFGAAMIFMPVASTVIEPRAAAAGFLVLDTLVTLPLLFGVIRRCDWVTVLPVSLSAMAVVPLGAAILAHADTSVLRWVLSAIVLAAVAILLLGWRYSGRPRLAASLGVGAVAGLLSGVSQVAAPPVVVFWAAGPNPPRTIRANLIVFFAIVSLSAFAAFYLNGFYDAGVVVLIVVLAPIYGLGILAGARLFGTAAPAIYRPVAYGIILLAAISSLPALDTWLR